MSESFITIEEVADSLGLTVAQIYESRRRKEFPGVLGHRRGKRLMWVQSELDAGPQEPLYLTAADAAVLELQAINKMLAKINRTLSTVQIYAKKVDEWVVVNVPTTTAEEDAANASRLVGHIKLPKGFKFLEDTGEEE